MMKKILPIAGFPVLWFGLSWKRFPSEASIFDQTTSAVEDVLMFRRDIGMLVRNFFGNLLAYLTVNLKLRTYRGIDGT